MTLTIEGLDGLCGSSQTMIVRVQPVEYTSSAGDLAFCSDNKKARLFISPWLYGAGVTFTQTPVSPLGATDTLNIHPYGQNGEFDATIHGIGQWEFEVTYVNIHGCVGVTTDTIYVLDTPESPEIDFAKYCEGDDVYLSATGVDQDSIYWYGDFLLTDTIGIGNPQFWGVAPDPALGDVFVWVSENNWACVSPRIQYKLPFNPSPVAEYEMAFTDTDDVAQVNIPDGTPVYGLTPFLINFSALNTVASDTLVWYHNWENNPDQATMNINNSNNANVSFNYTIPNLDKDGNFVDGAVVYENQLIITNEFGCSDTTENDVYSIASEEFYNVFTPNGDGQNDVFYIPVFGLENYKVQIFNRWGKLVYEWEDPNVGWTGEDQPDGVYFYVVSGINQDAERSEYKKQGTVTLTGAGN